MTCELTQDRQSCRRSNVERRLRCKVSSSSSKNFSVGRLCLITVVSTIICSHNALASARNLNRQFRQQFYLSNLRGGSNSDGNIPSGGGEQQLNDEDLDEYIDFLLAYADDKATEEDNPLFRNEVNDATLPEEAMPVEESVVVVQEEEEETKEEEKNIHHLESSTTNDDVVEPLVDDVNDDVQLDKMVETLVASIDDNEIEGEPFVEDDEAMTSTTTIQETSQTYEATEDDELSIPTMPKDFVETAEESPEEVNVNDVKEVEGAVEVEVEVMVDTSVASSVDDSSIETPIVEFIDDVSGEEQVDEREVESDTFYLGSSAVENMPLPVNVEADVSPATAEVATEPTSRVPLFTSFMQKIGLKKDEAQLADMANVGSEDHVEEITISEQVVDKEKVETTDSGTNEAVKESVIMISQVDVQSPEIKEFQELDKLENESSEADSTEAITPAASTVAVPDDEKYDDSKTNIASSFKQYYEGAWGSVKKIWSRNLWSGNEEIKATELPERDYTKIYEKYFAADHQLSEIDDISAKDKSNKLSVAFLRPWGTVSKYFIPKGIDKSEGSEGIHVNYYSIGIKGFVDEEPTPGTRASIDIDGPSVSFEDSDNFGRPYVSTTQEDINIEAYTEESSDRREDSEAEIIDEKLLEEKEEGILESTEFEDDVEEIPEDIEDNTEKEYVIQGGLETAEDVLGTSDTEVLNQEVPQDKDETEVVSASDILYEAEVSETIDMEVNAEETEVAASSDIEEAIVESTNAKVEKETDEDANVIKESIDMEVDTEEAPEDVGVSLESVSLEDDTEENTETIVETAHGKVDAGEVPEDLEVTTGSTDEEVDEDLPEESEIIDIIDADVHIGEVQRGEEVDDGEIPEKAQTTEVVAGGEEVREDIELVTEIDSVEATNADFLDDKEVVTEYAESVIVSADVEKEADDNEIHEDIEHIEDADNEVVQEVIEEHVDSVVIKVESNTEADGDVEIVAEYNEEIVEQDILENTKSKLIDAGVEEVMEGTDTITDDTGIEDDTLESPENIEVDTGVAEAEVANVEIFIEADETRIDTDQSDSSETTPDKVPLRTNIFTRLWGTTKTRSIATVENEVDSELAEVALEEFNEETDLSIDSDETSLEEGSRKPNLFVRLWGTVKEPNEIYSLGLQGIQERVEDGIISFEDGEDNGITEIEEEDVAEALDRDISVSIGIVDDREESSDSLESFESSEEDIYDKYDAVDVEISETQDATEIVPVENAVIEDVGAERNVLQLHSPERKEEKKYESEAQNVNIEVVTDPPILEQSEESVERTILQLHQEDSIIPDGSDHVVAIDQIVEEPDVSEMEVGYQSHIDDIEEDAEDSVVYKSAENSFIESDVDSLEESEADVMDEFVATDAVEYVDLEEDEHSVQGLDDEAEIEDSFFEDAVEVVIPEEEFGTIEEEDAKILFFTDTVEAISSDADTDTEAIEKEEEEDSELEVDEIVDTDVSDELSEENEIFKGLEIVESEEEEEVYVDEIDEEESGIFKRVNSSPYSLEIEMQNAHFLTRFLVNKGLQQVVMIAIVITEWVRFYIIAPFLESIRWIKEGKGQDLLQTVINTRGGALASSLSESEDIEQIDDKEENDKEEVDVDVGEEECSINSDDQISESIALNDGQHGEIERSDLEESVKNTQAATSLEKPIPAARPMPPNFVYRRLLQYGLIGHILIMESIMVSELFNLYVPQIQSLTNYVLYDVLKQKKNRDRRPGEPAHYATSGFINTGEGSRLRKSKKLRKADDEKALSQLKRVGNVNEAKYTYISQSFMKRHGLGPYKVAVSEIELNLESSEKASLSNKKIMTEKEDETDSDSGWILDALGMEEDDDTKSSASIDTSVGVSVGSGGPMASVGIELTLGKKKTKKTSSLRNVIVESSSSTSSKRKKPPTQRVSDSESGIMGRLRAQGANSLVGRSLLGAYPGDLPPPDEAADPRGVIDLAQRYGFGDWSDEDYTDADECPFGDDENDEDEDKDEDEDSFEDFYKDENEFRPKRKKSSKRTKAKKRGSSSSSQRPQSGGVEFGLKFGGSSAQQEQVSLSSASTTTRRKSSRKTSSSSVSFLGNRHRRRKKRSSQLPSLAMETVGGTSNKSKSTSTSTTTSLAMETLGGTSNKSTTSTTTSLAMETLGGTSSKSTSKSPDATASSPTSAKDILKDSVSQTVKRRTKTLSPAMSILNETKESTSSTSTKPETED